MQRSESNALGFIGVMIGMAALLISAIAVVVSNDSGTTSVAAGGGTTLLVSLKEFSITPQALEAPPGDVKIVITNNGATPHNITVKGSSQHTPDIEPGSSATVDLGNRADGTTLNLFCSVPGHEQSGMTATLTVKAGASSSGEAAATPGVTTATDTNAATDWQSMDAAMGAVAKEFPQKTEGHGGDILAPKLLPDGTKEFDLTSEVVDWQVSADKTVKAWTYNGVVPAPTIKVNVGDKVRIVLTNKLPESTTIHFHGVRVPNSMDGVFPYTQETPVQPGQTFTYEFTTLEPAVGMYHSHHDAQVQVPNGMAGAFLIGEMPIPAGYNVVQETSMVLNDSGTIGLSLNGKSFPATEPYKLKVGETLEVQYFNEGQIAHPMHLHQPAGLVIAKDGIPLTTPYKADTILVAPGERYTVLYKAVDPGVWAWHCHILSHAETPQGMFGMVTALIVEP